MKKLLILIVLSLLLLAGCGSADSAYGEEAYDMVETKEAYTEEQTEAMLDTVNSKPLDNRKIITTGSVDLKTKEFDDTILKIQERLYDLGGYIESSSVDGKNSNLPDDMQNRYAYFVVRIPSEDFEGYVNSLNTVGSISNVQTDTEDITNSYYDTEARVLTLETEETRLLELLTEAKNIEDIIVIEERLSYIRYDIESLTGTLKKWDNRVNYSTLTINIREVYEIVEPDETFLDEIGTTFKNSLSGVGSFFTELLFFIIWFIPNLIIFVPLGFIVYFIVKFIKKTQTKNKAK